MKLKTIIAMLAVGGLFVVPAFADHHGEGGAAKVEAAAEDKVAAYVVAFAGGG
ncbi:MAG: hypothetical protein AAGC74_01780 [Verrucomicrobiota bacterium]